MMHRHESDTGQEQCGLGKTGLLQQQQRVQVTHEEL